MQTKAFHERKMSDALRTIITTVDGNVISKCGFN